MAKKTEPGKRTRVKKSVEPEFDKEGNVASPAEIRDTDDPGDETQRRFRYQHAYGVILLTGVVTGKLGYESIWCEHHDDFLAQFSGGFNSYQVKTRIPELGAWELTTDGFVSAITKFAKLETRFPQKISRFKFVSNTQTFRSNSEGKVGRSPDKLIEAIAKSSNESELKHPFDKSIAKLASDCMTTSDRIFAVFKRLEIVVGPSLADFEAVLSQTHIASIEACRSLPPYQLNAIRDELIQKIYDASSNFVDDPAKHWTCINGAAANDPRILAKQLFPNIVEESVRAKSPPYFRYSPMATKTEARLTGNDLSTLEKKLIRGNLRQQMETMLRRTISTEQHLLKLAASKPDEISEIRNQLESVVQGVCDDASLQNAVNGEISGQRMLAQVQQRLEKLADERPQHVHHQPYDCLVGMAGLLTEECTVWWSNRFDLGEETV